LDQTVAHRERLLSAASPSIRLATDVDLPAIVAIYNAAIPEHQATADLHPVTPEDRYGWFAAHDTERHPLWIADQGAEVVGWLSLSTFYPRKAWDPTAEVSFYVDPAHQRSGVGRRLLAHAIAAAPNLGLCTMIAVVFGHNEASLRLLQSAGFELWGRLPGVTHMPEGRRDVVLYGLEVGANQA
jgi:L-amino acid N-acyltransferase YncA